MSVLNKNTVEPICLVLAFTAGTLINRRRTGRVHQVDIESAEQSSDEDEVEIFKRAATSAYSLQQRRGKAPNVVFRLLSRFFNAFPFLIEIWYWNLTYWLYQLLRAISARLIAGNDAIFALAQHHAIQVLSLESALGLALEQPFQSFILAQHAYLVPILRNIYYSHITVGVCFIIYTYTVLPPSVFQRIRRTIAADNAIAFVVITIWRCYPPRMLPSEYGFVDVLHGKGATGGNAWTQNRFQLTIAAMPSLHFGTSLFFAVCLVRFSPHRLVRLLAPLWPAAMLVTIVATANHFLLDAAVGATIPLLGWKYNALVLKLKPIHDWMFSWLTSRLDLVEEPTSSNKDSQD